MLPSHPLSQEPLQAPRDISRSHLLRLLWAGTVSQTPGSRAHLLSQSCNFSKEPGPPDGECYGNPPLGTGRACCLLGPHRARTRMGTNCWTYVCLTRLCVKLNMTSTQPITMRLLLASSLLLRHLLPTAKSQLPKPALATQSFTSAHPSAAVGRSPCAVWGGSVDSRAAPYAGPWATVSTPH